MNSNYAFGKRLGDMRLVDITNNTHVTDAKFEEEIGKFGLALGEEPAEETEDVEEREQEGAGLIM